MGGKIVSGWVSPLHCVHDVPCNTDFLNHNIIRFINNFIIWILGVLYFFHKIKTIFATFISSYLTDLKGVFSKISFLFIAEI